MIPTSVPENSEGRFKVLTTCISCAACWKLAPTLIKSHTSEAYAYFYQQPKDENETTLALQTVLLCPVNAIIDSQEETRERCFKSQAPHPIIKKPRDR